MSEVISAGRLAGIARAANNRRRAGPQDYPGVFSQASPSLGKQGKNTYSGRRFSAAGQPRRSAGKPPLPYRKRASSFGAAQVHR